MNHRKLSFIIAFSLCSTPIITSCGQTPTPETTATTQKEQPQKTQDEKKTTPQANESELIPTDDPNVFKTTKPLPLPEEAANYPKPKYPELGFENSLYGAQAVALYFEEVVPYAYNTGNHEELDDVCYETSKNCQALIDDVIRRKSEGTWFADYKETDIKVLGVGIPDPALNEGQVSFKISFTVTPYRIYDAKNKVLIRRPTEKMISATNLSFIKDRWVIVGVDSEVEK
ncbi:MAG: DUF6318 family protein [Actinomycetaceae bacterium]|nr:DUF6318 family protein [Actinomycetaceae bacterium]